MRRFIMGEIKTRPTDLDVDSFLMSVEPAKNAWTV